MSSAPTTKDQLIKTATILEDFAELHKAARYYAQAKEYVRSAKLYENSGDFNKAGDSYYAAGKLSEALKMYNRAGRKDKKMARLYEKTGNFREAANIWKSLECTRNWKRCTHKFREPTLFDLE
jgi:tetratricopeptide (TPR) repeat protein